MGDFPAKGSCLWNWRLGREKGSKGQYLFSAYILTKAALQAGGQVSPMPDSSETSHAGMP